jgi:hypothetical protein
MTGADGNPNYHYPLHMWYKHVVLNTTLPEESDDDLTRVATGISVRAPAVGHANIEGARGLRYGHVDRCRV